MATSKVVLITGCSTGIGRALAIQSARMGHTVYATARKPETLSELASERFRPLQLDVTDPGSIAAAVARIIAEVGYIDVLINNAGLNMIGPLAEVPLAHVQRIFDTNVIGLVAVTQAVFPHMARRRAGRIVNIGSVVGLLSTPFAGPYCASKAAVHALSETLRMEAAPFNVDVVVVQPGGVRSEIAASGAVNVEYFKDPEALYHPFAAGIERRAGASQESPADTDDFAREVLRRAYADTAPRIVRGGRGSRILPALAKLPGRLRDPLLRAQFGLKRLG